MKKIVRKFVVENNLDWAYGVEIKALRKDLDKLEKAGATHIE